MPTPVVEDEIGGGSEEKLSPKNDGIMWGFFFFLVPVFQIKSKIHAK